MHIQKKSFLDLQKNHRISNVKLHQQEPFNKFLIESHLCLTNSQIELNK